MNKATLDLWHKRIVELMARANQIRLQGEAKPLIGRGNPAPAHEMMAGYPLGDIKPFDLSGSITST